MKVRYVLTALVASLASFAVAATTGLAFQDGGSPFFTVTPGDSVHFRGLDLFCTTWRNDPDGNEAGPVFYCTRYSDSDSRAIGGSKYSFFVSDTAGRRVIYTAPRRP